MGTMLGNGLSNYTMYSVCKQTAYRACVDVRISTCTCTYHVVFFLLLVALLDTYLVTNVLSRLGIVIKSV